jgi:hypothetical protein
MKETQKWGQIYDSVRISLVRFGLSTYFVNLEFTNIRFLY